MSAAAVETRTSRRWDKHDPTDEQVEAILSDVTDGVHLDIAARRQEDPDGKRFTASSLRRYGQRNPEFAAALDEALRVRVDAMPDKVDAIVEQRALDPESPAAILLAFAARWHPEYRRMLQERRGRNMDGDKGGSPRLLDRVQVDGDLLTTEQMEELGEWLRGESAITLPRLELLVAIGQGRAPNPERAALEESAA